jgi:hypothetical protein
MWYTTIGVVISAVLFFGIHSFARPPPRTMTKEWQEATNEYLKVCSFQNVPSMAAFGSGGYCEMRLLTWFFTERENQPHLRHQQRRLQGQRLCAEQVCEGTRHQSRCGRVGSRHCFFRGWRSCSLVLRDLHLDQALYPSFPKSLHRNYILQTGA